MKELKKKICWFLVLILVVTGTIFISNKINLKSISTDIDYYDNNYVDNSANYYDEDNYYYDDSYYDNSASYSEMHESTEMNIGAAIFCELFVSIHMSVFVLMPLSRIFGKEKHTKLFLILFAIRVMILIIGDIYSPGITMMVDFISVFLGAFIVVPVCASLTGNRLNDIMNANSSNKKIVISTINYDIDNNSEVSDLEIANLGFGDKEVVKRGLVEHYKEILSYYENRNFTELVKVCSPGVYTNFKTEAELYDKVSEKLVVSDFIFTESKIIKAQKHGQQIFLDLKVTYSCIEYVVNEFESVVRGSKTKRKEYTKVLSFSKKMATNMVTKCPSCNASIDEEDLQFCSYCGTAINISGGSWVLKNEIILKEN